MYAQVGISWFGESQKGSQATSEVSNSEAARPFYTGVTFGTDPAHGVANLARSLVHGGRPIGVMLSSFRVHEAKSRSVGPSEAPSVKCTSGDHAGRWVAVSADTACKSPLCTGILPRGDQRPRWLWVPYDCYYHVFSQDDIGSCAASQQLQWLHVMGDEQQSSFLARLFALTDDNTLQDTDMPSLSYREVRVQSLCHSVLD